MKLIVLILSLLSCNAATFNDFIHAIHAVETGGRLGPILGDNGRAFGPLQIHREYFKDSGVQGNYKECADLQFSAKVVRAYLNKYAHHALLANDWETCARTHNGGPNGAKRSETIPYWDKVKKHLTR